MQCRKRAGARKLSGICKEMGDLRAGMEGKGKDVGKVFSMEKEYEPEAVMKRER